MANYNQGFSIIIKNRIQNMVKFFLFLTVLTICFSMFANHSKSNQTFNWVKDKVINRVEASISGTNIPPYQITEDRGQGEIGIYFDYKQGCSVSICGSPTIVNKEPLNLRVDLKNALYLQTEVNASLFSTSSQIAMRHRFYFLGDNRSSISVEFLFLRFNRFYGEGTGNYIIAGDNYKLITPAPFYLINKAFGTFFSRNISFSEICSVLLSMNIIKNGYYLNYIQTVFSNVGVGKIDIKVNKVFRQQAQFETKILEKRFEFPIAINNYQFNPKSLDYSNFTFPNKAVYVNQTISDFMFVDSPLNLNAEHFLVIGEYNGTWLTPQGNYGLPLPIAQTWIIPCNFSFSYKYYFLNTQQAICISIFLKAGIQDSQNVLNEIRICPWWSDFLLIQGKLVRIFEVKKKNYKLYVEQSSANSKKFLFIQTTKSESVFYSNLFEFVQYASFYSRSIKSQSITSVRAGIHFYVGKGTFEFKNFNLDILEQQQNPQYKSFNLLKKTLSVVLTNMLQLPNLSIVIKMLSLIQFIDSFSFYAYHQQNYDQGSKLFSRLTWNVANAKWNIAQLDQIYRKLNISYSHLAIPSSSPKTPIGYLILQENTNFLIQTEDFWIRTLPLTTSIFLFMHFIYKLLKRLKCKKKIIKRLIKFSMLSFLWVVVIGENLQYLSFRCFSQMFELRVSPGMLLNLILMYLVLFILVFYALTCYFLLPLFAKSENCLNEMLDGLIIRRQSVIYMTLMNAEKILNGMAHSLLCQHQLAQASFLLGIQLFVICFITFSKSSYRLKTIFVLHFLECILKIGINILMLLEIIFHETISKFSKKDLTNKLSDISDGLFSALFLLCIVDFFCSNLINFQLIESEIDLLETQRMHKRKTNGRSQLRNIIKNRIMDKKLIRKIYAKNWQNDDRISFFPIGKSQNTPEGKSRLKQKSQSSQKIPFIKTSKFKKARKDSTGDRLSFMRKRGKPLIKFH